MASITGNESYSYQNTIRDVVEIFDQLRASAPALISLIRTGAAAKATKHEWLEDSLSPTSSTIAGFDTDGDGTGIELASTAGMRAGSILRFATALDVSRTEQVQIASVDSATQLTVVRDYGSTTGVTLVVGDKVYLLSSPTLESSTAGTATSVEPTAAYNYTQIFDRDASISLTAKAVGLYGLENALDYQVQNKIKEIMWEINNALIYGRRVARTASVKGTAGGFLQFGESGNIDTTGGVISSAIINNILESIFQDGAVSDSIVILASENQARRISALNTAGSNPTIMKQPNDRNLGGYISTFTGDLPIQKGFQAQIVVEPNFLKDQIAVLDMNSIEMNWLQGRQIADKDATPNGADYVARRILGELSFTIKNGTKSHGFATGLTV